MERVCFVNERICRVSDACVGISDLGLQRAYAVFDFVRMCNGKLFHIQEHLTRLRNSAAALQLNLSHSNTEIIAIATELIAKSNLKNPAVRFLLTGGYGSWSLTDTRPNFILIPEELPDYPRNVYLNGGKLILAAYQRELPLVKTTNYLNAIRLDNLKHQKGAIDLLYHADNFISECPRSNLFIFAGDTLVTPKENVLRGITRMLILRLSREYFSISERSVTLDDLRSADEAFITATSKRVIPIVQIDDQKIGAGSVGERTKTVMQIFEEYNRNY